MTIVHVQQVKDAIVHIHISVVHVPLVIGPMQSLIFVNCAHRVPIQIRQNRPFVYHAHHSLVSTHTCFVFESSVVHFNTIMI
jgi:hypothetical protein